MNKILPIFIVIISLWTILAVYSISSVVNDASLNSQDEINYCKVYAEQMSVKGRYERGVKQYYLNGLWINESRIKEDCFK